MAVMPVMAIMRMPMIVVVMITTMVPADEHAHGHHQQQHEQRQCRRRWRPQGRNPKGPCSRATPKFLLATRYSRRAWGKWGSEGNQRPQQVAIRVQR